jgi:hypothetical protein
MKGRNIGINDRTDVTSMQLRYFSWHKIHATFPDSGLRHPSLTDIITTTILEVAVAVPMVGGIYEVCC